MNETGHWPTLRPKLSLNGEREWQATVTIKGRIFRHTSDMPAAALSGLVRTLADGLEICVAQIEALRGQA